mgnify:CR=1 FL=1
MASSPDKLSDSGPANVAEKCPGLKAFLLKSWQPVPSWGSTVVIFFIIGNYSKTEKTMMESFEN